MKKLALILYALLLASLACSTGGNATTPARPTNIPPQQTDTSVLFQDDFSDTSGDWGRVWDSADGSSVGYAESGYRILVNKAQNISWGVSGNKFERDVIVDVGAVKRGGAEDGFFGIICRYGKANGQENFYFLVFGSNGVSSIAKLADNSVSTLANMQRPDQFPTINDSDSIHIRAECIGNTLTLYLNDMQLVTATDDSFTSGDAGLIAGTADTLGTEVLFDNFIVTKP
jgi:hypothetical protein